MSPYVSKKQRAKFHQLLKEGKISAKTVAEFDAASKGMKLPERVSKKSASKKSSVKVKYR